MAKAAGSAVADFENKLYFHDIAVEATRAMHENARHAIEVFSNLTAAKA